MVVIFFNDGSEIAYKLLNSLRKVIDVKVEEGEPKIVFRENLIYYGYPIGFEIQTLNEIIRMLKEGVKLSLNIAKKVARSNSKIKVFVTSTCPYCPIAAITAAKFSIFNPKVKTEIIDAIFYPKIAEKFNVLAVPKIVVEKEGGIYEWEGAVPEHVFAERI